MSSLTRKPPIPAITFTPKLPSTHAPWFSPPSPQEQADPIILTISEAITRSSQTPLEHSLKHLLPTLTASHFLSLLSSNPLSLPPPSLLSFFHFLLSRPLFRHTPLSFLSMADHLLSHRHASSDAIPLLRLLVSRSGRHSAPSLFSAALQVSPSPRSTLPSLLITSYADLGFVSDAIQCLRLTRKYQLPLPFQSASRLLDRLMASDSPSAAWAFYSEILGYGFPPKVCTFNILMHSFCKEGKIREAHLMFDEISKCGAKPTVVSFNTLINGYCKIGDLDVGFDLKSRMLEHGVAPDVFTYSVLIKGLCNVGRLDDANKLFDEMFERGLVPNSVTFTTLIDGYCRAGKVEVGMEVFDRMTRGGVRPDLITFNTLLNGLCKVGDLKKAKKVVEVMRRNGLKPDKVTYTTLIDGCCKEGDSEMAVEIKMKMMVEGIELDDVTFTALISGLSREGLAVDAERTLHEMVSAGIIPDEVTYTMVIDAFCKKGEVRSGFKLLKEMQSKGLRPGVVTYNVLMNGLCKLGQMRNANMLLNAMLNVGVIPDDVTYNILLEGHCKHGDVEDHEKLRGEKGMKFSDIVDSRNIWSLFLQPLALIMRRDCQMLYGHWQNCSVCAIVPADRERWLLSYKLLYYERCPSEVETNCAIVDKLSLWNGYSLLSGSLKDKDRELGEAQAEIKALKLSECAREKAVEELTEALAKAEEKLKLTESLLESKNLEIKRINDEKKASMAAQFAAEATLRRVHAAQKGDDMPPIEAILAPLEAELKLARQEIGNLQDDNRALDRLTKSKEAALLDAEWTVQIALAKASMVDDLQNKNQELIKQVEICQEENKILDKLHRQKVQEVEKLSQTV
ncbi:hypothetical protein J5N97_005616 [Dioscorea zingiberensis]|uniref:Pentatricopeptide repeat-containing protein n=1 Tax=Dioscorea zingiberensis TaxID=325984 RepID=A0A9D5D8H1_9LILI|nr:hypothetical protein J5N97_005616 [Dioscorea zingiberensis]